MAFTLSALFSLAGALGVSFLGSGCDQGSVTAVPLTVSVPASLVPARIKSVTQGGTDTLVTYLKYDSRGTLIRELRPTSIREWDSLGRYTGVRVRDSARYLERLEWVTADSAVRTQSTGLVVRDKYFNLRPNCWCADSILHMVGDSVRVTRTFRFDEQDKPVRVTLYWPDGSAEIVQTYTNTYNADGRLVGVYIQDIESGTVVTTIRTIEYDTLKNVTETR